MQLPRKMSAQNVNPKKPNPDLAGGSHTSGNREHKTTGNEIRFAGDERKDKLYEPKHKQKLVRVLTVVAYVIFVSMGAILLSLYYTFLWDPKDVSIRMRAKPECGNIKLSSPLTTPSIVNETQIERTTTKSITVGNEHTQEPEIIATSETTRPQKNLLTILTETTEMSSSDSTMPQDFRTNSSRTETSREKFTKKRPEST